MKVSPKGKRDRKRRAHCIKRSSGTRYPTRFIFFDVETDTVDDKGTQKMKLAYAVYWEINEYKGTEKVEWASATDPDMLYDLIEAKSNRNTRVWVLSANIWFDLRVSGILAGLKRSKWRCTGFYYRGHTLIASFNQGRRRIDFVNIQNFFNFPVSRIGDSIDLPKIKIDLKRASQGDLALYCKRDVEIIYQAFRTLYYFIKDNKLGSINYTLPSISYSCYRYSFIPMNITVHTQEDILQMERDAYFGGRCECFKIGTFKGGPYYKLDVNAMYSHVMKLHEYPTRLDKVSCKAKKGVLLRFSKKYCYIALVELNTDEPLYPYRQGGKLIFPTGRFETTLSTPSLLYAIKKGHVKRIIKVAAYYKGMLFNDFVNYFYTKRLAYRMDKNPAFAYVCKLILNSLYGKFGQRLRVIVEEKEGDSDNNFRRLYRDVDKQRNYVHQSFFGLEQLIEMSEEEGLNSAPAIAAHVTDYARLYLWSLIKKAGIVNCYYCDTDSLIVNEKGKKNLSRLIDPDDLGSLKIEEVTNCLTIRGAKNYRFGKKERIKGIPAAAKRLGKGRYSFSHFPTPVEEIRAGLKEDYRIEVREKVLSLKYDKGIVLKSGRVKPFRFPLVSGEKEKAVS